MGQDMGERASLSFAGTMHTALARFTQRPSTPIANARNPKLAQETAKRSNSSCRQPLSNTRTRRAKSACCERTNTATAVRARTSGASGTHRVETLEVLELHVEAEKHVFEEEQTQ